MVGWRSVSAIKALFVILPQVRGSITPQQKKKEKRKKYEKYINNNDKTKETKKHTLNTKQVGD